MKRILIRTICLLAAFGVNSSFAIPVPENIVWRNNDLGIVVYRDSVKKDDGSPAVFWYRAPITLLEKDNKIILKKVARPNNTFEYTFYIKPYMTRDLENYLAGEIPELKNSAQLRPLKAKKIKLIIDQFQALAEPNFSEIDQLTDIEYLNTAHPVRITVPADRAEEFDIFTDTAPGIAGYMLLFYKSERMDKELKINVSYKEVYDALNIGGSGRLEFAKAEIDLAVKNLLETKYANIESKGDLPITDAINRAMAECFEPINPASRGTGSSLPGSIPRTTSPYRGTNTPLFGNPTTPVDPFSSSDQDLLESSALAEYQLRADTPMPTMAFDASTKIAAADTMNDSDPTFNPGNAGTGGTSLGNIQKELEFKFKKELINNDRTFFYHQKHYTDDTEAVKIPFFLTKERQNNSGPISIQNLRESHLIVRGSHTEAKPLATGITLQQNQQLVINATFQFYGESYYNAFNRKAYRWDSSWPNPAGDLYYRVSPRAQWVPVNGRAIINTNTLDRGEIEFYMDKKKIWEKLPQLYRGWMLLPMPISPLIPAVPPIFLYKTFTPEFDITINGRYISFGEN